MASIACLPMEHVLHLEMLPHKHGELWEDYLGSTQGLAKCVPKQYNVCCTSSSFAPTSGPLQYFLQDPKQT